jgi:hypothetical protein
MKGEKQMVTDRAEFDNLRKRLIKAKESHEMAVREISEMLRVLNDAPKILPEFGGLVSSLEEEKPAKHAVRYNQNFAKDIDDYLADYPNDQAVSVSEMLKTLQRDKGIAGKKESLTAYAYSVLKRRLKEGKLHYKDGLGYYKTRQSQRDEESSTLVHSS